MTGQLPNAIRKTGRRVLGASSGRSKVDNETWWWWNKNIQDHTHREKH